MRRTGRRWQKAFPDPEPAARFLPGEKDQQSGGAAAAESAFFAGPPAMYKRNNSCNSVVYTYKIHLIVYKKIFFIVIYQFIASFLFMLQ